MIDSICSTVAATFANGPTVNPEHQEPKRPWFVLTYDEQEEIVSASYSIRDAITKTQIKLQEKNT